MPESHPLRDRLSAAVADDYELLHPLGQGGMAAVFLARDLTLGRQVAIKVMAPELVAVPGMAERFVQEARIAAALSHPNIIPIHAVRRHGDLLYIVMRYVAGRPLDAILAESGTLPVGMVRMIVAQVGGALEAAHRGGVVHRDIKPANILIDEQGDAIVADFGIARIAERPGQTQAGQTVGTPEYMSPEQCAGGAVDGRADQYSLGIVAYQLLTGSPPFTGEGLVQIVWKMLNESAAPITSKRADCPAALAAVIHRMIAHKPEERWSSVAEAVAALPALAGVNDTELRYDLAMRAKGRSDAMRSSSAVTVISDGKLSSAPVAAPSARSTNVTPTSAQLAICAGPAAASIRLPLPAAVLSIGDEIQLRPEFLDATGAQLAAAQVLWTASEPDVAHVSPSGRIFAHKIGQCVITAQSGDAMARLAVHVTRAAPRALAIAQKLTAMEVGDRVPLTLITGEPDGLLPHPRLASWKSSDTAVVEVDALGRLIARAEGKAEISVRVAGVNAKLDLRVTKAMISAVQVSVPAPRVSVGQPVQLGAKPANTKGHPLDGMPVRWEVSDPAIAAISSEGLLIPLRSGQVLVAARVGGRVGTTRVVVA